MERSPERKGIWTFLPEAPGAKKPLASIMKEKDRIADSTDDEENSPAGLHQVRSG